MPNNDHIIRIESPAQLDAIERRAAQRRASDVELRRTMRRLILAMEITVGLTRVALEDRADVQVHLDFCDKLMDEAKEIL